MRGRLKCRSILGQWSHRAASILWVGWLDAWQSTCMCPDYYRGRTRECMKEGAWQTYIELVELQSAILLLK